MVLAHRDRRVQVRRPRVVGQNGIREVSIDLALVQHIWWRSKDVVLGDSSIRSVSVGWWIMLLAYVVGVQVGVVQLRFHVLARQVALPIGHGRILLHNFRLVVNVDLLGHLVLLLLYLDGLQLRSCRGHNSAWRSDIPVGVDIASHGLTLSIDNVSMLWPLIIVLRKVLVPAIRWNRVSIVAKKFSAIREAHL